MRKIDKMNKSKGNMEYYDVHYKVFVGGKVKMIILVIRWWIVKIE